MSSFKIVPVLIKDNTAEHMPSLPYDFGEHKNDRFRLCSNSCYHLCCRNSKGHTSIEYRSQHFNESIFVSMSVFGTNLWAWIREQLDNDDIFHCIEFLKFLKKFVKDFQWMDTFLGVIVCCRMTFLWYLSGYIKISCYLKRLCITFYQVVSTKYAPYLL